MKKINWTWIYVALVLWLMLLMVLLWGVEARFS